MPDYKDILKNGWHPEKSGTTGGIKGQMKSLVGRGDDKNKYEHHTPRPLSSLKDPSTFAPPPKRTLTGSSGSLPNSPGHPPVQQHQQQQQPHPDPEEPPKQPKPWSLNTTGLSTANLPPPPGRRDGGRPPAPQPPSSRPSSTSSTGSRPPPPALPPRLPPRSSPPTSSSPSNTTANALANLTQSISAASIGGDKGVPKPNQSSIDRLTAAGISVPGLGIGIGNSTSHPAPPPRTTGSPSPAAKQPPQIPSGFSSHLAKAATTSFQNRQQSQEGGTGSGYGTTLAKEGLNRYKTASPSEKAAIHGAATSAAKQGFNRYQTATPSERAAVSGAASSMLSSAVAAAKKKPPPPPPPAKKKPQFLGGNKPAQEEEDDAPPPVPLATRPRFP
ncbi:hypothetical protein B0T21DRAFT_447415 [Apiosordaria backusii]|uniref:Uncharacterized protein n=1 Tax=Apiosordaria backusii TaxID=314023 RepID=A0AA40F088_9PEZI|nr:hypothetical protein B0T21DRAFT_447415 [Apiosordaria backusii]